MKKIVSVSLGSSGLDYEITTDLFGERFHVRRIGTDGDTEKARRLVAEHDGLVDAIGLGGMAIEFRIGDRTWVHRETLRIARAARTTPVVGGRALKRIVDRWAIRDIGDREPDLFEERNVLFLSGIANYDMFHVMKGFTDHFIFADPILHFGVPQTLHTEDGLHRYARLAMPLLTRRPYVSFFPRGRTGEELQTWLLTRPYEKADVIAGDLGLVLHYTPRDLSGKTVVTDTVDDERLEDLRARGVEVVCTTTPEVFPHRRADLNVLQAIFLAHLKKPPRDVTDEDYLRLLRSLGAAPRMIDLRARPRRRVKFAALIVAADRESLMGHPRLRWMRLLPGPVQARVERGLATAPPFAYARVSGIAGGDTVAEGWILTLPASAPEIVARGPEFLIGRMRRAAGIAQQLGARVMGVSTFDRALSAAAGAVAATEPIPITSGLSMALSADLWAGREACLRVGMAAGEDGRIDGTALLLGARTEGPASVAARLLAVGFRRVVLVAPQADEALELLREIEREIPGSEVEISTTLQGYPGEADLVVSGLDPDSAKAVGLADLKPGAVLLDLSRPTAFGVEEARGRDDVLLVYAGDLELPGDVRFSHPIGLPPRVAYAAVVEAAVLALEHRFECFSPGEAVEAERVKEIYRIARKHGVRLAAIRGPEGVVDEETVEKVRAARAQAAAAHRRVPGPRAALVT